MWDELFFKHLFIFFLKFSHNKRINKSYPSSFLRAKMDKPKSQITRPYNWSTSAPKLINNPEKERGEKEKAF